MDITDGIKVLESIIEDKNGDYCFMQEKDVEALKFVLDTLKAELGEKLTNGFLDGWQGIIANTNKPNSV